MRHALIATHLMNQARSVAAEAHWRQDVDAPADLPAATSRRADRNRRPRRRLSLRQRARVHRTHA